MSQLRKKILTVSLIILILTTALGLSKINNQTQSDFDGYSNVLVLGTHKLQIEIANTPSARVRGLSNRESLDTNSGMLFVFEEPGFHQIWMKDMNFDIDILWLDENKEVIHIEERVNPDTYPQSFSPPSPELYILEVNAGWVANHNIKLGDKAEF